MFSAEGSQPEAKTWVCPREMLAATMQARPCVTPAAGGLSTTLTGVLVPYPQGVTRARLRRCPNISTPRSLPLAGFVAWISLSCSLGCSVTTPSPL